MILFFGFFAAHSVATIFLQPSLYSCLLFRSHVILSVSLKLFLILLQPFFLQPYLHRIFRSHVIFEFVSLQPFCRPFFAAISFEHVHVLSVALCVAAIFCSDVLVVFRGHFSAAISYILISFAIFLLLFFCSCFCCSHFSVAISFLKTFLQQFFCCL